MRLARGAGHAQREYYPQCRSLNVHAVARSACAAGGGHARRASCIGFRYRSLLLRHC
jgi:hypothetical protein